MNTTNVLNSSKALEGNPVRGFQKLFVEVEPVRQRTICGEVDITKYVLEAMARRAVEEKQFDAARDAKVVMKSFLDEETLTSLKKAKNKIDANYEMHLLHSSLPYMAKASLKSFEKEQGKLTKELLKIVDGLGEKWDVITSSYEEKLRAYFSETNFSDDDYKKIMGKVPSFEKFKKSYEGVGSFVVKPIAANTKRCNALSKATDGFKDILLSEMNMVVASALGDIVDLCERVILYYEEDGALPRQTIGSIRKAKEKFLKKISFLENPLLKELAEDLDGLTVKNVVEVASTAEEILFTIGEIVDKYEISDMVDLSDDYKKKVAVV